MNGKVDLNLDKALAMVAERLQSWAELIVRNVPNMFVAVAVGALTYSLARILSRITCKLMRRLTGNPAIRNLASDAAFGLTMVIGLFVALGVLNLDKTVTSLLAGAGVVGLALGFAFQEIASNFVAGVLIAVKEPFRIGDVLETGGLTGEVTEMAIRTTTLTTFDGNQIMVPNKKLFTEPLKNYSSSPRRRLDLKLGISYDSDLERATDLLTDSLSVLAGRIPSEPVGVYLSEFGESSINIEIHIWIHYPADNNYLKTRHEAILRIKNVLDEAGIEIPFPVRTLHLADSAAPGQLLSRSKVRGSAERGRRSLPGPDPESRQGTFFDRSAGV